MPMKNQREQLAYQRGWMAGRRAAFFSGKKCEECDLTIQLEIHHKDPEEKVSHRIWSWSAEKQEAELAKCRVLCSKCHDRQHLSTSPEFDAEILKYHREHRASERRLAAKFGISKAVVHRILLKARMPD